MRMDQRSDWSLLRAWREGDAGAFEALVRRYQTPLLRHARALLGTGGLPEDAVQDAFLRLAQKPPDVPETARGDPRAEEAVIAAWLHRVTRNLCMDTLRSETRRRRREEEVAVLDESAGGVDAVEEQDTRQAVERGLERLPDDQREVLVLRLFGERSYKEIAEITGRKVGTIGWLISVGLKALSNELAPLVDAGGVTERVRVAGLQGERS